jgi:hypothetical protein
LVCTSVCTSEAESDYESAPGASAGEPPDVDLVTVVNAWPKLPAAVRAGIAALVKASAGGD